MNEFTNMVTLADLPSQVAAAAPFNESSDTMPGTSPIPVTTGSLSHHTPGAEKESSSKGCKQPSEVESIAHCNLNASAVSVSHSPSLIAPCCPDGVSQYSSNPRVEGEEVKYMCAASTPPETCLKGRHPDGENCRTPTAAKPPEAEPEPGIDVAAVASGRYDNCSPSPDVRGPEDGPLLAEAVQDRVENDTPALADAGRDASGSSLTQYRVQTRSCSTLGGADIRAVPRPPHSCTSRSRNPGVAEGKAAALSPSSVVAAPEGPHLSSAEGFALLQHRVEARAVEVAAQRKHVRRLDRARTHSVDCPAEGKGDTVTIERADLTSLRRDCEEQELLIAAYDAANREATQQVKALEARIKEMEAEMAGERRTLEREAMRVGQTGQERNADTAAKLRRVLQLEGQLASHQEAAAAREAELKLRVDSLRAEKQTLETRLMAADPGALTDQVRTEVAQMRGEYEAQLGALRERLAWYSENQRLLTENDDLLSAQRALINELRDRLDTVKRTTSDERLPALQQQVKELRAALDRQQVGVVATLVREAAGSVKEQQDEVESLRQEADRQRQAADEAREGAERRIRALQQQHERVKAEFERRMQDMQSVDPSGHNGSEALRVRELEAELAAARSKHEKEVEALRAHRAQRTDLLTEGSAVLKERTNVDPWSTQDSHPASATSQSLTKQWVRLRQQLAEAKATSQAKDGQIARLESRTQQLQAELQKQAGAGSSAEVANEVMHLRDLLARQTAMQAELQSQLTVATAARAEAEQQCLTVANHAQLAASEMQSQVAQKAMQLETAQSVLTSLQQMHSDTASALIAARTAHADELQRLLAAQDTLVSAAVREAASREAQQAEGHIAVLECQLEGSQSRIRDLEQQVQEMKLGKEWSPTAREVHALEQQLRAMEARFVEHKRQNQWHGVLRQPQAMGSTTPVPSRDLMWAALPAPSNHNKPLDNSVHDKLDFLQNEVERVIEWALARQHGCSVDHA